MTIRGIPEYSWIGKKFYGGSILGWGAILKEAGLIKMWVKQFILGLTREMNKGNSI